MNESTQRTKFVKQVLAKKYGFKNVRVVNGTGTAYGWVEARVNIPEPTHIECDCPSGDNRWLYGHTCPRHQTEWRRIEQEARDLVYKKMAEAGLRFYHYYADDGYNSERDEFLLTVNFIK